MTATMTREHSAGQTQNANIRLDITTCCVCGTTFGIEMVFHATLRKNGQKFFCPNGHPLAYGNSRMEQLEKDLETQRRLLDAERQRHADTELRRQQTKSQLTRLTNRIAFGVCPCCHRSFGDLKRHMQTQHPDFLRVNGKVGEAPDHESTERLLAQPIEDMMTVQEAARYKNVLEQTVRHAIYKRKLPAIQIKGGAYRIPRESVEKWVVRGSR